MHGRPKLEQNNYHDVIIIKNIGLPNSLLVLVINVYIVCARCCKTHDIVLWNLNCTYIRFGAQRNASN